ncbi:hypothetical protein P171DRAFT_404960 [Karstenula rhodostoma CBS 690.94]|uniref:F-box domain-containing protein n=1 Tax=Karstenula rhodostoma CBS 690.94 TaxID=1392251 RepID=A0A9P4UF37_9PLEO|nr:hypothetical protein P171DRAFT_404960 [Karstenula rhodostoma CBS 690.94]
MDALSQELIDLISSHLERTDLKNTLLVSRQFQYAAEQQSGIFSSVTLTADEESRDQFLAIYSTYRFRFLREVMFGTTIGGLNDEDDAEEICRDTQGELRAMDVDFTNQIHRLCSTLNTFEKRIKHLFDYSKRIHLNVLAPTRKLLGYQCFHREYCSWRVHLLSPSTLPDIAIVQSLGIFEPVGEMDDPSQAEGFFPRKLDYGVILDLAIKCPNLETLQCVVGGNEWVGSFSSQSMNESCHDCPGPRRDSRHDFENAVLLPPRLREVKLGFLRQFSWAEDWDERLVIPNLVQLALFDPFSTSLRLLSYQLRRMNLHVIADHTLFWPGDRSEAMPLWPNMESMNITFHISHPSGSWYFQPPLPNTSIPTRGFEVTAEHYPPYAPTERDIANDDSRDTRDLAWMEDTNFTFCHVRAVPNKEVLIPFLSSFARAATRMPALQDFAIWTHFDYSTVSKYVNEYSSYELAWGIAYAMPGEQDFMVSPPRYRKSDYSADRRFWWRVGTWRPDAELHSFFETIGRKEHGEGLTEFWNDDGITDPKSDGGCGNGLDHSRWFTDWTNRRWPPSQY